MNRGKCPECGTEDFATNIMIDNAEAYGGGVYHAKCHYCGEVIKVRTYRVAVVEVVGKSTQEESDFFE